MVCIKCGTDNMDGTSHCSVCGQLLCNQSSAKTMAKAKPKQKTRGMALLCAWVGWGLLQWYLGDYVAAKERLKLLLKSFLLTFVVVGIFFLMYATILHLKDFFKVLFVRNLYDVDGNIIPWRKPKNGR